MPAKDTIYFTKQQIERLIELYQGEENLWNIGSPDYHKKNKKNDSLEKMKKKKIPGYSSLYMYFFVHYEINVALLQKQLYHSIYNLLKL